MALDPKHKMLAAGAAALLGCAPLSGCGLLEESWTGTCSEGEGVYYLIDATLSTAADGIAGDQLDGLAYVIEKTAEKCAALTVARFGGSQTEIDSLGTRQLRAEGLTDDEKAVSARLIASDVFNTFESELVGGDVAQASDQIGAIRWACGELAGEGTLVMATDGLMTTPYDVMSPSFNAAEASAVGQEIGDSLPVGCEGVDVELVGLGRTASLTERPTPENLQALELLWQSIFAAGGFAEGWLITTEDSRWVDARTRIGVSG